MAGAAAEANDVIVATAGLSVAAVAIGSPVSPSCFSERKASRATVVLKTNMSTQLHPFRSHTGVLERGIGREPLLSSASTQELEEALAARRIKSQAAKEKNEREQKKPRLLSGPEPGLPGFGTQSVRGVGADDGVQRFDLTGDDDDLMGGEPAGPAPTIRDRDDALPHGEELRAPYASHVTGAELPPWVRSLFRALS